jgi:hypothetical protein
MEWQRGEDLLPTGRIAVRWMVRKADMPTQKLTAEIIAAVEMRRRTRAALAPLDREKYRPKSHAPVLPAHSV